MPCFAVAAVYSGEQNGLHQMYYFRALSSEIISLSKALWVQQFKETADHLANGNRVTLIQIFPKMIVFVQSIAGWFLPQFSDELRKVICDKAIVICKMLWTEFRNFLSGHVAMHTVKECRVSSHFRWERVEKTGCFEQNIHTLIDVAYEYH